MAGAGAALVLASAGAGRAEGWNIRDLGFYETKDECMRRAETVIGWYRDTYSSSYVTRLSWTSYGYNLSPGENDAVIICSIDGTGRRAILAINGASETDRTTVADRLEQYWNDLP